MAPVSPLTTESMSEAPSAAAVPSTENLEVIRKFAETYAQRTGTYFCSDPGVTAVVLEGLARHKQELGGALCPCRHYEDKEAEVSQAFWNCPCVPMRERKECHCLLFLQKTTLSGAKIRPSRLKRSAPTLPLPPPEPHEHRIHRQ